MVRHEAASRDFIWFRPWMKWSVAALAVAAVVIVRCPADGAPPDIPLPYHNRAALVCSDCHTMHSSQQHSYSGGASVSPPSGPPETYPWTTAPTAKLLRRVSSAQICLACHDGQPGVPDVVGGDANGLGDDRAAGLFADLNASNYKGHNLSPSPGDLCTRCHFGGNFTTAGVTCTDCHNPHGNGGYRNLQWASSPNNPSQPKIIAFANATGINKYRQDNIGYTAPNGDNTWREVTNICADCHHVFVSPSYTESTSPFKKHPGTNSDAGAYVPINRSGASSDPTNWVNGGNGFSVPRVPFLVQNATNYAQATAIAPTNEVFCLTCHKAHGSAYSFGLRWPYDGTGAPGTAPAGCQQCHNR
jgi:hypothetical protein